MPDADGRIRGISLAGVSIPWLEPCAEECDCCKVGELCPGCEGGCDGCPCCWDEGVVSHECEGATE